MKKLMIIVLVFGMASVSEAAMFFSVNGDENPAGLIALATNDTVNIGVWGDGSEYWGTFYIGIHTGNPGSLEINNYVMYYQGNKSWIEWEYDTFVSGVLQVNNPCINVQLEDVIIPGDVRRLPLGPEPNPLVDDIIFRATGIGEVLVILTNGDGVLLDSQLFGIGAGPVPEPMTVLLLGVGGLLLRRRRT